MAWGKKNTFRSRRREVRMYRRHLIVSGSVAFCVLVLGVLVWYGARRPEVTIATVVVSGGSTVSHDVVHDKVESVLSGTYALLIPRHFSYLLPNTEIAAAINAIPRVHNAVVTRTSRNELSVSFDEYVPYALWCDSVPDTASSTPSCMFVDDQGFAYAEAPALFGETLIRFVIEGKKPEQGAHVYDTQTLSHYRSFADAIATYHNSRLSSITETKDGDLVLHLSGGVSLLITKEANIQNIFENIESVLGAAEFKGKPLEAFEYIDLRFGNKVYVKEWGAGDESATTSATTGIETSPVTPAPVTPSESTSTNIVPSITAPVSTTSRR